MSASSPRAWKEGVGVVLPPDELSAEELAVPLIGKEKGRMMASLISVRPVVVPEASGGLFLDSHCNNTSIARRTRNTGVLSLEIRACIFFLAWPPVYVLTMEE